MSSYSPTSEKPCPRFERCPEKLTKIFNFLDQLKRDLDVQKDYEVEEWADIMILACRSDTRVPGLGTALAKEGIRVMEDHGFTVGFLFQNWLTFCVFSLRYLLGQPQVTFQAEYSRN